MRLNVRVKDPSFLLCFPPLQYTTDELVRPDGTLAANEQPEEGIRKRTCMSSQRQALRSHKRSRPLLGHGHPTPVVNGAADVSIRGENKGA